MKKIISLIICAVLICGISTYLVGAENNYCSLFENSINDLLISMDANEKPEVGEGKSFPLEVILNSIKRKIISNYEMEDDNKYYIPASDFEEMVKKNFAVVDIDALHNFESDYAGQNIKIYDADREAYAFLDNNVNQSNNNLFYVIKGYVADGDKYSVYGYIINLDKPNEEATEKTETVDYKGNKYIVVDKLKNIVETDGTDVKFHSWEKISNITNVDEMITPPKGQDNNTSSKPDDTTSSKPTDTDNSKPDDTNSSNPDSSNPDETNQPVTPPLEENPMVTVLAPQSVKLEAELDAFPESTVVKVEEISDSGKINSIGAVLSGVSTKFKAFEITATCKELSVQPNGVVKAIFNIPADYKLGRVVLYYISETGLKEEVLSYVDEKNRTVVAELTHFSTYVIAETIQPKDAAQAEIDKLKDENTEEGGSGSIILIIIIVILAVGAGVAGFFIYKKVKNKSGEDKKTEVVVAPKMKKQAAPKVKKPTEQKHKKQPKEEPEEYGFEIIETNVQKAIEPNETDKFEE